MQAATTDNVQVLALYACEKFGATLAMSPDTVHKIERLVLPTPEPAAVKFLKATVGYSKNDSASYLGRSLAGQQFVALAAALVTTMGPFRAAEAVQAMLVSSATDKTLVPTVTQLKDLLASLQPRYHSIGYPDEVLGWAMLLENARGVPCDILQLTGGIGFSVAPKPHVEKLVDAFRQLQRLGEHHLTSISIEIDSLYAPWTIAFTKWCIGSPPSILIEGGMTILNQDQSKVTIIAFKSKSTSPFSLRIKLFSSIEKPSLLVERSGPGYQRNWWMLSMRSYGKFLLASAGTQAGLYALREATPYALTLVYNGLRVVPRDLVYDERFMSHKPAHGILRRSKRYTLYCLKNR